jgi:hypothetical protein
MKNKFWLSLLAANTLLLVAHSPMASAAPISDNQTDIASLSQTIAESIGFHPDTHSLIELAISRALTAKKLNDSPVPPPMVTAGVPMPSNNLRNTDRSGDTLGRTPQQPTPPVKKPVPLTNQPPIGKIAVPTKDPLEQDPILPTNQPAGDSTAAPEPRRVRYGGARG